MTAGTLPDCLGCLLYLISCHNLHSLTAQALHLNFTACRQYDPIAAAARMRLFECNYIALFIFIQEEFICHVIILSKCL